jgi:hypothetical protein
MDCISIYLRVYHVINLQVKFDVDISNFIKITENSLELNLLGETTNINDKE